MDKQQLHATDLKLRRENQIKAEVDQIGRHQKIRMSNSMLSHPDKHLKMIQAGGFQREGYHPHKHNASVGQISEMKLESSIEVIKQKYHEAKTSKQVLKTQNMAEKFESGAKTHLDIEDMEFDDRLIQQERQRS